MSSFRLRIEETTSGYRAVAPDIKNSFDAAERRRQKIQESKFLGGDMEHTHLVKGLDFALLQKVRSEISNREQEEMEDAEELSEDEEDEKKAGDRDEKRDPVAALQANCKTIMAKNILR